MGKFPLVEIVVLIALVLLVGSFFVDSSRRAPMLLGGLALGSLAGLELSIREHFGGFRSHSALLAGAVAAAAITATYFVTKGGGAGIAIVPVVVGGSCSWPRSGCSGRRSPGAREEWASGGEHARQDALQPEPAPSLFPC